MPAGPPDPTPPQPDLDTTAARAAEERYRAALAAGLPERAAWDEAVELFRMHHPAWPLPLAESEAARAVGGRIGARRTTERVSEAGHQAARRPPAALLARLARPAGPHDFGAASAAPARPVPVVPSWLPVAAQAVTASAVSG